MDNSKKGEAEGDLWAGTPGPDDVRRLSLFLIEDEDDVALLIRKSLERAEHKVTHCRSAADALIVLAQTTFDLVLLDQKLPAFFPR